ncbi:hypothetical protein DACRYDRAFT_111928 [Dacryopinax primogenitus]|uniref:Transcription initiation factor TFIID subunit 12 domain-containing protein n=1 Tax=Dacryopinax primogenitus (strain DJM 731) TaxID=1858805 RepID=M5G0R2_DACPD|nr:uncharacterized protein DACRYDRAFT_111928 [Dacryopinax primogenitus]EJT97387.1 hypothetical protein DACRYDRAFT_111928 [Dacryopinax primogenitus]
MSTTPSAPSSQPKPATPAPSQSQPSGSAGDLLKALDNALAFAASKPEAARQIAEALRSHMPGLVTLAHEGRLTQSQFQQLEALMKSGSQPAPQQPQAAMSAANGWTNGRPTPQRSQSVATSVVPQTPTAASYNAYYPNGVPAPEYDEREWLRQQIQQLAIQIDPDAVLEKDTEELLIDATFDFIKDTTEFGCRLAKHRSADVLGVKDVQLYLERQLGIRIPGFATEETRQPQTDLPIAAPPKAKPIAGARK